MAMKDSDKKIPNEEQNEQINPQKTNTAKDSRPAVQGDSTKMQNPNRNLPKGGNPVGRDTAEHNSVSGGKSLQGNNARSNPTSDKTHN
ncbi:MAG TPA: hypothetical protein VK927_10335 [Adhaeribacter sp.]|nr:hypothetical protein [Adhaeribacter sp.]